MQIFTKDFLKLIPALFQDVKLDKLFYKSKQIFTIDYEFIYKCRKINNI
jgi:hypothetical protein